MTNTQYHIPIFNMRGINESIVFVRTNNTDDLLLKSLVNTLYADQTVVLVRGESFSKVRKSLYSLNYNIILVSDEIIKPDELETNTFKHVFRSYWSTVFIIVTVQNGSETCHNGKFNETYLHDIDSFLTYIWRRYMMVRVTVSFPYTCPYHYIIYGDKKKTSSALYDRKIKIIEARNKEELRSAILKYSHYRQLTEGYPLRAHVFDRFPTSITDCNGIELYRSVNLNYSNGYCGLDGLVMNDYITYHRYNLTLPKDESCDIYGFVDPMTNRLSGSLSCIVNKKIDISFNSRFMVIYTDKHYFYLYYITVDTLSVVMKIPGVIPLWHYAFKSALTLRSSIMLLALIFLLGIITWASAWILMYIDNQQPRKLYIYIFNAMTCTIFGFPIRRSNRFRILRGTSLICSIILLAYYQGNVNNIFATLIRYKEMKTLTQLYRSGNILYTSPSIYSLLITNANEEDKEQATYFKKMTVQDDSLGPCNRGYHQGTSSNYYDLCTAYVLERDYAATTARGQDAQIQVLMNFTDSRGSPLMYVLEQPFHVYYLSYICSHDFLFTQETVSFMMRLLEAGLPNKYYVWTRRTLSLVDTYPKTSAEPRPFGKIKLKQLRVAFIILVVGYLLATVSFAVEVFYLGKVKNKMYAVESTQSRASLEISD